MTDSSKQKPIVRRVVFVLEPERRRQVLEVLWYVDALHMHIDPDMYRIELEEVKMLQRMFGEGAEDPPATISVTHHEVFALLLCIAAANTYSRRKSSPFRASLSDQQFHDLDRWVAQSERWFLTPLKEE